MNHVTFETARKLKDAGFPQPEMERGQSWYSVNGHEILITGTSGKYAHGVDESSHRYTALLPGALTFAPTATDILAQFAEYRIDKRGLLSSKFIRIYTDPEGMNRAINAPDESSLAEAAGLIYLEINQ